jgi:hypothetical protein
MTAPVNPAIKSALIEALVTSLNQVKKGKKCAKVGGSRSEDNKGRKFGRKKFSKDRNRKTNRKQNNRDENNKHNRKPKFSR